MIKNHQDHPLMGIWSPGGIKMKWIRLKCDINRKYQVNVIKIKVI